MFCNIYLVFFFKLEISNSLNSSFSDFILCKNCNDSHLSGKSKKKNKKKCFDLQWVQIFLGRRVH